MSAAELEAHVMDRIELPAFLVAGQTYPRKQDWLIATVLAGLAGTFVQIRARSAPAAVPR